MGLREGFNLVIGKQFTIAMIALALAGCEVYKKLSDNECISLISGVSEIPFKNGLPAEGTYYEILEKSGDRDVTNCLLDNVTNLAQLPDPRVNVPGRRSSVALGDISVFMLVSMYDIPFTTFIDETEWAHSGVYAYFKYIESEGSRDEVVKIFREKLTRSGRMKLRRI